MRLMLLEEPEVDVALLVWPSGCHEMDDLRMQGTPRCITDQRSMAGSPPTDFHLTRTLVAGPVHCSVWLSRVLSRSFEGNHWEPLVRIFETSLYEVDGSA